MREALIAMLIERNGSDDARSNLSVIQVFGELFERCVHQSHSPKKAQAFFLGKRRSGKYLLKIQNLCVRHITHFNPPRLLIFNCNAFTAYCSNCAIVGAFL